MATRSTIAMKTPEGKIRAIYCHWDGYLDYNGKVLMNFYTDPAKVLKLINLGDISSLKEQIGEKHSFDRHYDQPELEDMFANWTLAYHRDRGEDWSSVAPCTYETAKDWVTEFDMGTEYAYLFDGKDWLVHSMGNMDSNGFPIFDYVEVALLQEITE